MINSGHNQNQIEQDRLGLRIAARLSDATHELPHDISERLRASRVQALAKRKTSVTQTATSIALSGGAAVLTFGNERFSGWDRLASVVTLLALVIGLIAINMIQNENRANEIAEIDTALLMDDLPPLAYADDGFAHFLKQSTGQHP
jgi:hypothetical protein